MTCGPLDVLVSRECAGGPERPRHECGHQAGQVSCSASTTSSTCARRHLDAAHKLVAPAVGEVVLFRANADSLTNLCGTRIDPGDCGLQPVEYSAYSFESCREAWARRIRCPVTGTAAAQVDLLLPDGHQLASGQRMLARAIFRFGCHSGRRCFFLSRCHRRCRRARSYPVIRLHVIGERFTKAGRTRKALVRHLAA